MVVLQRIPVCLEEALSSDKRVEMVDQDAHSVCLLLDEHLDVVASKLLLVEEDNLELWIVESTDE